jgi:tetratricopeptide (TPR) repeat protein
MQQLSPIVIAFSTIIFAGIASAQTLDEHRARCLGPQFSLDLAHGLRITDDVRIASCTAIIEAGQETKSNLAWAFRARAFRYSAKRDYDRAISDLSEAIELNPKSALLFSNRAAAYAPMGDYDHAIQDYGQEMKLWPNWAGTLISRGRVYAAKGDTDQAIADYSQALRLLPPPQPPSLDGKYLRALLFRGEAYRAKGNIDKAIEDFGTALKAAPGYWCGLYYRGQTYRDKGDEQRAKQDFDELNRRGGGGIGAGYPPDGCNRY